MNKGILPKTLKMLFELDFGAVEKGIGLQEKKYLTQLKYTMLDYMDEKSKLLTEVFVDHQEKKKEEKAKSPGSTIANISALGTNDATSYEEAKFVEHVPLKFVHSVQLPHGIAFQLNPGVKPQGIQMVANTVYNEGKPK